MPPKAAADIAAARCTKARFSATLWSLGNSMKQPKKTTTTKPRIGSPIIFIVASRPIVTPSFSHKSRGVSRRGQGDQAVIARCDEHRGEGDILVVDEHVAEPHRRGCQEQSSEAAGPGRCERAAKFVDIENPDHPKQSEDEVPGIVGEKGDELLQQQGEHIRSSAVVIGNAETGDTVIVAGGTQKCVYPARALKTSGFVGCEAVARVSHHDHGEKSRGEDRHGDLICAPRGQTGPLTEYCRKGRRRVAWRLRLRAAALLPFPATCAFKPPHSSTPRATYACGFYSRHHHCPQVGHEKLSVEWNASRQL